MSKPPSDEAEATPPPAPQQQQQQPGPDKKSGGSSSSRSRSVTEKTAPSSASSSTSTSTAAPKPCAKAAQDMQLEAKAQNAAHEQHQPKKHHQQQQQQHSPAASVSSASSASGTATVAASSAGTSSYTRQAHTRPRKHGGNNSSNANSSSNAASAAATSGSATATTLSQTSASSVAANSSSLPPSAVSAPPYVPQQQQQQFHHYAAPAPVPVYDYVPQGAVYYPPVYHHHHHHPPGQPEAVVPNGAAPLPQAFVMPAAGPAAAAAGSAPLAPKVIPAGGPGGSGPATGRFTPSPHSVTSGASSPASSTFCQSGVSSAAAAATTTCASVTTNGTAVSASTSCANAAMMANSSNNSSSNGNSTANGQHVVNYHIHTGEVLSVQLGDQMSIIPGPATIRMISTNSSPPMPYPMSVPPGHMIQQILDQNGTLQHVILTQDPYSPQQQAGPTHSGYMAPPPGTTPGAASPSPNVPAGSAMAPYATSPNIPVAVPSGPPPSGTGPPPPPPPAPAMNFNGRGATPTSTSSSSQSRPFVPNATGTPFVPPPGTVTGVPPPAPAQSPGCWVPSAAPPGFSVNNGPMERPHSIRIRDPTHERLVKKSKNRQLQQQLQQQGNSSQHSTPSTSPAKRGSKGGGSSPFGGKYSQQHNPSQSVTVTTTYYHQQQQQSQALHGLVVALPTSTANGRHGSHSRSQHSYRVKDGSHLNSSNFRHSSSSSVSPSSSSSSSKRHGHSHMTAPASSSIRHDDSEESGVGHEEDEEMSQLLIELLSNIRTPRVSEISARSALLQWGPPVRDPAESKFESLEPIADSDFIYDVLLSDKGKDGKYRTIFSGPTIECKLADLRPCTEYHIRIHALYESLKGGASDTVSFTTQSCAPDQPAPPKAINRTKTSISLRWNAPESNGAHISHYVLETDEGKGADSPFVECFSGRAKSYNVSKLMTAHQYRFRLIAANELGFSRPSEVVQFTTQGSAPPQPQAPGLKLATKSSLHLVWSKRLQDDDFILQMDDRISGHGFLTCYNGRDTEHISTGLRRSTAYKFRLQAHNAEGKSVWSEEASFMTQPDIPSPPLRPASKGRLHPHSFKVRWDPPSDDGGSLVTHYQLELDDGTHGWKTVYTGGDTECLCDGLKPGVTYKVRVSCTSEGGVSKFSEICHISTEPVCPGQCAPPRVHGKPKASSLHLEWGWPESDGGAPVTEFEIDMTSPDNQTKCVYRGNNTECVVASLLPGRPYLFQVRAHNRAGAGPWSESLEVVSGAGAPGQPKEPKIVISRAGTLVFTWETPINNGAIIQEYQLQMAIISRSVVQLIQNEAAPSSFTDDEEENNEDEDVSDDDSCEDDDSPDSHDEAEDSEDEMKGESLNAKKQGRKLAKHIEDEPVSPPFSRIVMEDVEDPVYVTLYCGPATQFEARNLEAATVYNFRLCAVNSAGPSEWTELVQMRTPAAKPAAVCMPMLQAVSPTNMILEWHHPDCQGEPITHYVVEVGPGRSDTTNGPEARICLQDLKPDTTYNIRVQAVNAIGTGPFSPVCRLSTRPLPPAPPKLECVNINHNSLRLRWGDSRVNAAESCHYSVEMENSRSQFQTIYTGTSVSHKVNKLSENTNYRFRICAANDAGQGPFSPIQEFRTAFSHPPPLKNPPRVSAITEDGCMVEWNPVKLPTNQVGETHYKVQMNKNRDSETKTVYTGRDVQSRVTGLDSRTEYTLRVAAVRVIPEGLNQHSIGNQLVGPMSTPCVFTTLSGTDSNLHPGAGVISCGDAKGAGQSSKTASRGKGMTEAQQAFAIVAGLTLFAVVVAMIIQHVLA